MLRSKLNYLNFILTVIAVSLTIIVLQNASIIPAAKASTLNNMLPLDKDGNLKVKLPEDMSVTVSNTVDVNVKDAPELDVNVKDAPTLGVNIEKAPELDVKVDDISATSGEVPVRIVK
jgi:hypothetical protein